VPVIGPSPSPANSYTVGYLVDRTFDLLLGAERQEMNQLAADIDNAQTTFTMNFPLNSLQRGTYMAVDDEVMYVWDTSVSSSTLSVTVQRQMKGTAAVPHDANSMVYVNPFFTRYQVRNSLQDVIRSWGPQVFAVRTQDIPVQDLIRGYDLGNIGPWYSGLKLQMSFDTFSDVSDDGFFLGTGINDKEWREISSWRIDQQANTTDFPSGNALIITTPVPPYDQPRTLHFTYSAPFDVDTSFIDSTNCITQVGMDSSDLDIPPLGAAAQLAMGREMRRMLTQAQGQVADLQQFPPGYATQAAEKFKAMHDLRLRDAVLRLRGTYPMRRIT
jgi:hypothetical protein